MTTLRLKTSEDVSSLPLPIQYRLVRETSASYPDPVHISIAKGEYRGVLTLDDNGGFISFH